jgi:CubicO group peptidase (beta-lactamase class C family)
LPIAGAFFITLAEANKTDMKRFFLLLILCFCVCCQKKSPVAENSRLSAETLSNTLDSICRLGYFEGFGVAVVNREGIMYTKGFGKGAQNHPYTKTTMQPVASISKTLIGIALMKAQELGRLRLDDPVNKYLAFKVANPAFPDEAITLRQLATHTSSITDTDAYMDNAYILDNDPELVSTIYHYPQHFKRPGQNIAMEKFLKNILIPGGPWYSPGGFLPHKPGERYEYSNIGATLAALAIEKATGMPYDAFTAKYILEPLHMSHSMWPSGQGGGMQLSSLYESPGKPLPPYSLVTYPDGGFISSAEDMGKYLTELLNGFTGKGTLLATGSYKELFSPQLGETNFEGRSRNNPYNEEYNSGIFMGMSYKGYLGHTGGDPGVCSIMFIDPVSKTGRFLMVNTSFSTKEGNDAFYAIWDAMEKYIVRQK